MRLRLPELLAKHNLTPYAVAAKSGGRISRSTIYRIAFRKGVVANFDAELLDALCDVLGEKPAALLTRDPPPRGAPWPGFTARTAG